MSGTLLQVAIVCDNASASYGGEAILPIQYFRYLRARGLVVWLVAHERSRDELTSMFPSEARICYVKETRAHRLLWQLSRALPDAVGHFTFSLVSRLLVQASQRSIVRRLVKEGRVDVVHQPTPVSPREPSLLYGLGVPVVIGPLNGGMRYPAAFAVRSTLLERWLRRAGGGAFTALNLIWPGKHRAAALLVANERTKAVLPKSLAARALVMSENGVDLDLWRPSDSDTPTVERPITFAFVGRLVGLKAVDLLLQAFFLASRRCTLRLAIIGDGAERAALEQQARRLDGHPTCDGDAAVRFTGWLTQQECARELSLADGLVMPSLHDCGGAVVLEAMATGLPVIATAWGGALEYLDASCGILVPPTSPMALVEGLAAAMVRLADSPDERAALGRAGRLKVERHYDWQNKVDWMMGVYGSVLEQSTPPEVPASPERRAEEMSVDS